MKRERRCLKNENFIGLKERGNNNEKMDREKIHSEYIEQVA